VLCCHSKQYPFVDLEQFEQFVKIAGLVDYQNLTNMGIVELFLRNSGSQKLLSRPKFFDLILQIIRTKYGLPQQPL